MALNKKENIKLSIIYLLYENIDDLFESISSLKKNSDIAASEIIIVDHSEREEYEKIIKSSYPGITYVKQDNLGYGSGNNLGASVAHGEYLLFLNPDTIIEKEMIKHLVSFLDKKNNTAIVAPEFFHPNGKRFKKSGSRALSPISAIFSLSILSKIFPKNKIMKRYFRFNRPKKRPFKMSAVPGSAYMIRKKIFNKVGGFDENFFLYFEEHDLGKRVLESGYDIYVQPKSKVIHKWKSSKRSKKLKKIFQQSRFYYFKKHFGIIRAIITESFLRFDKYDAAFILVLLLALVLRFYKVWEFDSYFGEIGDNLLDIKNYYLNREIPLIGPPTSHEWLDFGPLFYWIYGPILIFSDFNPVSHAYFTASVSTLVVLFNYFFIGRLTNKFIALISSTFIAVSPFYISFGGRFFSVVLLLIYPCIYYLLRHRKTKETKYIIISGLFMGLMLNFHLTPILLIPPTLLMLFIYRTKTIKSDSVKYFSAIILTYIPIIIYDLTHNFGMLSKFLIWIPYRVGGFLGIIPKNNIDSMGLEANINSLSWFISTSLSNQPYLKLLIIIVFSLGLLKLIVDIYFGRNRNVFWDITIISFVFGYIGIFVHGSPPSHYYMPIAFAPILIISYLIYTYKKKLGYLILVFISIIVIGNSFNYFSDQYFYRDRTKVSASGTVSYQLKLEASRAIIRDAEGSYFKLERQGNLDGFEGDFAQDYQYLLWWFGNEPIVVADQIIRDQSFDIAYKIWETEDPSENLETVFAKGGLIVTKQRVL